jgi:HTH-type transcriptional regulator/antitoxin HigA
VSEPILLSKDKYPDVASHPGSPLQEEVREREMTQRAFAEAIGRPYQVVNGICSQRKAITAETAILIGRQLGTSADFWMNLQSRYELTIAYHKLLRATPA